MFELDGALFELRVTFELEEALAELEVVHEAGG